MKKPSKPIKTCGELGFRTRKTNQPCSRKQGWGMGRTTGPCKGHSNYRILELKKQAITESLANGSTITDACKAAKVDRKTFYYWINSDKSFHEIVEQAQESAIDRVEEVLAETAEGGNVTAMIFFLCNRRRQKWQHVNRIEVTGRNGAPIEAHRIDITVTLEEYEQLLARSDGPEKKNGDPRQIDSRKRLDPPSTNGKTG